VPKGRDGNGWRPFASELRSTVQFLQSLYGGGSAGVRNEGRLSLGMGWAKVSDAGVKISSGGGWEEAVCRGTCGTEDYSDSVLIDEGCF
jgi:hypothetical protein